MTKKYVVKILVPFLDGMIKDIYISRIITLCRYKYITRYFQLEVFYLITIEINFRLKVSAESS